MKKAILFLFTFLSFGAAFAQEAQSLPPSNAEMAFDKEVHDYGTIIQGADGNYEFKFKNTGSEPLIISNAKVSCGCTVPSWPKEPIKPGATSTLKVSYDTKRVGAFNKSVTITSNAKSGVKNLTIKGVVNAAPVEETFPGKKPVEGAPVEKF